MGPSSGGRVGTSRGTETVGGEVRGEEEEEAITSVGVLKIRYRMKIKPLVSYRNDSAVCF